MKEFYLLDYKGKFTIISDDVGELDYEVGRISKKEAIEQADWRKEDALYYGVPAVITKDKDLLKVYADT